MPKTGSARPTSLKAVPAEPKSRPCRGWAGVWACGPGQFLNLTDRWISTFHSKGGAIIAHIILVFCYIYGWFCVIKHQYHNILYYVRKSGHELFHSFVDGIQ